MTRNSIEVTGARQHNLAGFNLSIPRDRMVVITGPSGSGKSSLAFHTLYAEGQRRYVESLSAYARQFLERLPKPAVESIEGLSPTISVKQRSGGRNPRSTVGTITEILDYLRLLYAKVGIPYSPSGEELVAHTPAEMVDRVLSLPNNKKFSVEAPLHDEMTLADLRRSGFARVRFEGELMAIDQLSDSFVMQAGVHLVVDRLSIRDGIRGRLADAIETALTHGGGQVAIHPVDSEPIMMRTVLESSDGSFRMPSITTQLFSFNSPAGACPSCGGLGYTQRYDPAKVVPDPTLSIKGGAVAPWGRSKGVFLKHNLAALKKKEPKVKLDVPWKSLSSAVRKRLMFGPKLKGEPDPKKFEGILPGLERRARDYEQRKREEGASEAKVFAYLEDELGRYAVRGICPECNGARLRKESSLVKLFGHSIVSLCEMPIAEAFDAVQGFSLDTFQAAIADRVLAEVIERLRFLVDVGLGYLSLGRGSATLSGGEAQRIRLASQLGSGLMGVVYVLDEPSIGLHPRDNKKLIGTLLALRDKGNTVLIVEHDLDTIRAADYVVELGPGAGQYGGQIIAKGTPKAIAKNRNSVTAPLLKKKGVPLKQSVRTPSGTLRILDATTNNLQHVNVDIPLGVRVSVTGVSGSGKSSLVMHTLIPRVRAFLQGGEPDGFSIHDSKMGIDKLVRVDQSAIGRTPRSNPATYTGLLTPIRELFSSLPEARARGYKPGRFSFNAKGGRCEACQGAGRVRVSMNFLADVFVTCKVCKGHRYDRETLAVAYRGHNISEVLAMEVSEARDVFAAIPRIRSTLDVLAQVGLGYLELGRSAPTLSGGEAQRLKIAKELSRKSSGATLYVLDEPTTGLHGTDVEQLLQALDRLVDAGNSVVVIEHHLDVIASSDHVIDIGREGGSDGGTVVFEGNPAGLTECADSYTGAALAQEWKKVDPS